MKRRVGRQRRRKSHKPSLLEQFEAYLVEHDSLSPAEAKEYREAVEAFQGEMGLSDASFTALRPDQIDACIEVLDREIAKLKDEIAKENETDETN